MTKQMTKLETRLIVRCHYCGSSNVTFDATVDWNEVEQRHEVVTIHDDATCQDCESDGWRVADWKDMKPNAMDVLGIVM